MTRHSLPPIGHSIHGQTQATLMHLHQQSLERTLQSTITLVDADNNPIAANQQQQRSHTKKKKKYYPWLQRDSLAQREKIGGEGSRRRQRHDNGKYIILILVVLEGTYGVWTRFKKGEWCCLSFLAFLSSNCSYRSFLSVFMSECACLPPSLPSPSDPTSSIFPLYEKWPLDPLSATSKIAI